MDPNSYFHFSQQIKIHRQEIYKKEVLIKTLEKEKLINEVSNFEFICTLILFTYY